MAQGAAGASPFEPYACRSQQGCQGSGWTERGRLAIHGDLTGRLGARASLPGRCQASPVTGGTVPEVLLCPHTQEGKAADLRPRREEPGEEHAAKTAANVFGLGPASSMSSVRRARRACTAVMGVFSLTGGGQEERTSTGTGMPTERNAATPTALACWLRLRPHSLTELERPSG